MVEKKKKPLYPGLRFPQPFYVNVYRRLHRAARALASTTLPHEFSAKNKRAGPILTFLSLSAFPIAFWLTEIFHGKFSSGDTASQALRCSTSPISFRTPVEGRQFGWTISVVRNLVNQSPTARRAWGPITASTHDDCRINRKRAPLLCLLSAILSTSQFT